MAQLAFSIVLKDRVAPSTGLTNQECFYETGKEYEKVVFAPEPQTADQKIYGGYEVEHVEGMIHQPKYARLRGDDKLIIQNDNLLTVLQYLTDEEIGCLKLVNHQWANLIFNYVKHLPKLVIKDFDHLREGLVWHERKTTTSRKLDKFSKETYFQKIIVDSTQKNFEYLQNHVAKNGSVIGRDVALSTSHNKDLNFLAFEPRMIDNLIVSMDCLRFEIQYINVLEKSYLLKRPSYFYSVHAKKVKISLGCIGPILVPPQAFGGASPKTIVEFLFDENSPLDNRHKFSMSGDSDSRIGYFADNFIMPLFVGFYKVG
uniref:Uncharacterized protein n=1 Tax=Acrobeloides nanus TaxID=290746 RepID=A0A914DQM6_9BILA